MDAFSYLSVLLSIILGLAVTQVLQGYRGLLLARARVRPYMPTLIWSGLILVFATQSWWASFGLSGYPEWSFAAFGIVLLQTVLLYMMAALVLPDLPAGETADLEAHYYREVPPFFGVFLVMLGTSLAKDWMLNGGLPAMHNLAFHGVFAVLAVLAIALRRPIVHQLLAPVAVLATAFYIGLLFARL